ncbi:MAG: carbonic anhydrase [Thermicanus sp.]|nr:carbonic anhydrase [Thermicanus sp.]
MNKLEEILEFNRQFVAEKEYTTLQATKYPDKKMVILTCMDARLLELLPRAMNLRNGDVKMIRNAGAVVSHPFGSVMRSILLSIVDLGAEEVFVIGHHDCGMYRADPNSLKEKIVKHGIDPERISMLEHAGIDLDRWLSGFDSVEDSVRNSVSMIRNHPLMPRGTAVHGLVIHPATGELTVVENGYLAEK